MSNKNIAPMLKAIIAAALFGVSAPISKLLLGEIAPTLMASYIYLGSGIGLFLLRYNQSSKNRFKDEARLTKSDWPWLIGAVFVGGIAAPIVLMFSLKNTPASTASLLLNFEGVATTVIAVVAFKEAVGKRIWMAVLLITTTSIFLSWDSSGQWGFSLGAIGVLGACILWGMDNNFTRNVSAKDPLSIVIIKGLSAGTFSFILSVVLGLSLPSLKFVLWAMLLGFFQLRAEYRIIYSGYERTRVCQDKHFVWNSSFCWSSIIFAFIQRQPGDIVFPFTTYHDHWDCLFT